MEITLLADCPHEVNTIAAWYFGEWAHVMPGITEEVVRDKVSEKAVYRDRFPLAIVIHKNNRLVGVAELKLHEHKKYPHYQHWLGGVFVNADNRGEGISTVLVKEAQARAQALGVNTLYLQCESHNVALYQKHGFQVLHSIKYQAMNISIMVWSADI